MQIQAFIFDLDGVLVSTDEQHYRAWKRLAQEENLPYSREVNQRQRGVSRMESLEIMLEHVNRRYTQEEKEEMAQRKNRYYREMIQTIGPESILAGVVPFLTELQGMGIRLAVASSSKNAGDILRSTGLRGLLAAVADGTQISHSKPDPEVFLLAAQLLGVNPARCIAVEDAQSGVQAARAAGMKTLAVGAACGCPDACISLNSLADAAAPIVCGQFLSEEEIR